MTALVDMIIGDSALLLWFSVSRVKSRNSTKIEIFQNMLSMSAFFFVNQI